MTRPPALLSRPMIEFNQLPSLTLHASRYEQFMPVGWPQDVLNDNSRTGAIWHRHWSRDILRRLGLTDQPVLDTAAPELRVALLQPDALAICAARVGATLCGDRLRRVINGDELRLLVGAFGKDAVMFARSMVARAYPSLDGVVQWDVVRTVETARTLGWCTLNAALSQTPAELFSRAQLKLPDVSAQKSPLDAADALSLSLAAIAPEGW